MGDPRKFRNKYSGPVHPWQRARLEEESVLVKEYGLKTKRELWKVSSKLKSFAQQAKSLIALRTDQAEVERKQLIDRVARLGLISSSAKLDDVLGLSVRDLLNRRLQTVVFKMGLAKSPYQARQFIVHEHILIGGKKVSAPSYIVPVSEESLITFVGSSSLSNPEHPERAVRAKAQPVVEEKKEKPKARAVKKAHKRTEDAVKKSDKSKGEAA